MLRRCALRQAVTSAVQADHFREAGLGKAHAVDICSAEIDGDGNQYAVAAAFS
jgi:hypothetical protein